jgi:cytochrome c5
MKVTAIQLVSLTLVIFSLGNLSAQQHANSTDAEQPLAKNMAASAQPLTPAAADPGERKFQANCSRCHTAPEQISPRIVGTVVRHMRVRASLSAEDERDILRYLAP